MKQQKQAPSTMKVEIGGVEYTYELKEKEEEKCKFEVGDVIIYMNNCIRIFEGEYRDSVMSSNALDLERNEYYIECKCQRYPVSDYTKATPEQEILFNQKCIENGCWFDMNNKKWIELKEGGVYTIEDFIFIYGKYVESDNSLKFKAALENKSYIYIYDKGLTIRRADWGNISEATEEEKQQLFDALKENGKQWNAEKKCVEDFKWKPGYGDKYWHVSSSCTAINTINVSCDSDIIMISMGNCFQSKEGAKKASEYIQKCWLDFKNK